MPGYRYRSSEVEGEEKEMKILGWIKTILECLTIIGPLLKIPKLEKTVEAMSTGIEAYSLHPENVSEGKRVKSYIRNAAEAAGVEDYLHKKVKKFTSRIWKKLF